MYVLCIIFLDIWNGKWPCQFTETPQFHQETGGCRSVDLVKGRVAGSMKCMKGLWKGLEGLLTELGPGDPVTDRINGDRSEVTRE